MLKLFRWLPLSRVLRRFKKSRKRDLFVLVFLAFDLLIGSVCVWYFENAAIEDPESRKTFGDCIWLALTTATTVGYGDVTATTTGGRMASVLFFYLGGVGVAAYLLGRMVEIGLEFRLREQRGLVMVKLENHIIICNYPSVRMVDQMIRELRADLRSKDRSIVVVTDAIKEATPEHEDVHFVRGSPMDEAPLHRASISQAWRAIVLAPNLDLPHADALVSVAVMMVKKLNQNCLCVVECADRTREALLKSAGADRVVFAGNLASNLVVQETIDYGVSALIEDFSSNRDGAQFYSERNEVGSHTVAEFEQVLRYFDFCAHLLALYRTTNEQCKHLSLPPPDEIICKGDYIIYLARNRVNWPEVQSRLSGEKPS